MATNLMSAVTAVGVSNSLKPPTGKIQHTVYVNFKSLAATKITAVVMKFQGSMTNAGAITGVISDPVIAIGSTAERVANGAFNYRIENVNYSKGAVAAGSTFTAAHVIAASSWGAINLYVNIAGTIISRVPGSSQTGIQTYASAALAHAAADAIIYPDPYGACYIGRILINSDGTTWTANTDDMTNASDLTTATFISDTPSFTDVQTHTFSAAEITAQKAKFHITDITEKYIRLYLSTLTGTGEVNAYYQSGGAS